MRCAICDAPLPILSSGDICGVCTWHVREALGYVDPYAPKIEQEKIDDFITIDSNFTRKSDQD